ncbi:MAG: PAS domain-containing protein [Gammaproteobacteria bacterium]|nr:PAS domain-containing protein [Gammaproteobacteria bacterium]
MTRDNLMEDHLRGLLERVGDQVDAVSDESAWIEVIQRMDSIYADIVRYQVELEEKNANLEEAHQFIQSVISSISDVLIVADIHGNIQQVNGALEGLIGRSAADITGAPLATLFMPDYVDMVEDFAEHIRTGVINDCEVELTGPGGEGAPIAINCTPRFDHDGRLSGLVITGRPLGELRRAYQDLRETHDRLQMAQQQLVQSEKMASLGQLVAGVAHELNNPISFVFGNMHALKRYEQRLASYLQAIHDGADREAREALRSELKIDRLLQDIEPLIEGSLEGAERVGEIVEDLRRFSTPNQQQCQPFDLARVVNTAADWVTKARRERPDVCIDMPVELTINGYEGYVHQILVNLIQNAADALEGRNDPRIDINVAVDNRRARIRVRDNGPGIATDQVLRVFDPFFTTKPVGKGTGLGLYISYNLATEQCAGRLGAANLPGGGAEFVFELPLEHGA